MSCNTSYLGTLVCRMARRTCTDQCYPVSAYEAHFDRPRRTRSDIERCRCIPATSALGIAPNRHPEATDPALVSDNCNVICNVIGNIIQYK